MSRHVLAPPPDWPDHVIGTGYWFLPSTGATLPDPVTEFLAVGPPPVFIGFGSMAGPDPAATTATVLEAVDRAGVRAILASGWGGLCTDRRRADHVLVLDEVAHDLLLPHVAAVVHHGGAGTTAAAVAAGRPQVITPFVADQPFWAARMHTLGVAPPPVPQRGITASNLAIAITRATTDPGLAACAAALGTRVLAEGGTVKAAAVLEALHRETRR